MFERTSNFFWPATKLAKAMFLMPDTRRRGELDANKRTDAEDSLWGSFALETIRLDDEYPQPHGVHWLISIAEILMLDIKVIQSQLPYKHQLKSYPLPKLCNEHLLRASFNNLRADLADPKNNVRINLSNLNFTKEADFSNFIFPIDTDFSNTKFVTDVFFNNAVFFETANFEKATFQEEGSHCKETAKFRNTVFDKIANFRNAIFWGYANFKGSKLKGRAFFQDAIFKHHAPRFYDATFNNEMTWAGIKLPNFDEARVDRYIKKGNKFELVDDKRTKENHRRRIEENQNSYENISILLDGTKKYHDRYLFFCAEMRCRRRLEKNVFIWLAFWLYQIFADYGYGVGLAFLWWGGHILVGTAAIFITVFCIDMTLKEIIFCSISTSFANANPFVFIGFKESGLTDCYQKLQEFSPVGFGYIRIIQAIVGIPLLFLLLTTLRVRFRLK